VPPSPGPATDRGQSLDVCGCLVIADITADMTADIICSYLVIADITPDMNCIQCFDTVGWVAGRASGL